MTAMPVAVLYDALRSCRVSCFTYGSDETFAEWGRSTVGGVAGRPGSIKTLVGIPVVRDYSVPGNVLRVHYRGGDSRDIELFTMEEAK